MVSCSRELRVLSLVPGRLRLHLPGWAGRDVERVQNRLRRVNGVDSVEANPLTGNALIRFDRQTTSEKTLLGELQEAWDGWLAEQDRVPAPRSGTASMRRVGDHVGESGIASSSLVRAGVRALLGHAALDSLWFAGGFLGEALGLPLAGLGPLHLLMDVGVWVAALGSGNSNSARR